MNIATLGLDIATLDIKIANLESTDFNCLYSLNKLEKSIYLPGCEETFSLTNGLVELNGTWTIVGERKVELSNIELSDDFKMLDMYLYFILATLKVIMVVMDQIQLCQQILTC